MSTAVKQLNGRIECRRTQVQVALGHLDLAMTGEFLNRPRRRATHRQVRTERVAHDMNAVAHVRLGTGSSWIRQGIRSATPIKKESATFLS
jgi:hypothetical protein